MRVGVAGTGRMGAPMAANLAAAGHNVTLWNRTRASAETLAGKIGASVADTPRALAENCEVVVTMLSDDHASDLVHRGEEGLFAAGGPRTLLQMGTMSPDHITALVEAAPEGVRVIDVPVSGATQAAADAQLLLMAGCREDEIGDAAAVLQALGRRIIYIGARGHGAVMKLAVNALIHGINQTLSEAVTLAEAAGIPPDRAFDVIEDSAAGAPMISYRRPLYLDEAAHEVTFTVALALKDMTVTQALADRLGIAMPQGAVTRDILARADDAGYADRDMAAILDFMRKDRR